MLLFDIMFEYFFDAMIEYLVDTASFKKLNWSELLRAISFYYFCCVADS